MTPLTAGIVPSATLSALATLAEQGSNRLRSTRPRRLIMTSPTLNKKKPGQSAAAAPAAAPAPATAAPKNAWAQGAPKVGGSAGTTPAASAAPAATPAMPGL